MFELYCDKFVFSIVDLANMGKWDLGSDDDEPSPKIIDNPNLQEGQGSWMDHETDDMYLLEKPPIRSREDPGNAMRTSGTRKRNWRMTLRLLNGIFQHQTSNPLTTNGL